MVTTRLWKRLALPVVALATLSALLTGSAPAMLAQDATPPGTPEASEIMLTSPAADLHNGSCANPQLEPDYELGALDRQAFNSENFLEDELFEENPEGYENDAVLDEDLDDGEDLDGDGEIDYGIDVDADGALDEDEIIALAAAPETVVWRVESEIDATFDDLFGSPEVLAIHQSPDDYGTIVACGDLSTAQFAEDQDEVLIALSPVNNSDFYGYAVFERDTGNVPMFGDNTTGVTVYLFEGLPTRRDTLAGTPAAGQ